MLGDKRYVMDATPHLFLIIHF